MRQSEQSSQASSAAEGSPGRRKALSTIRYSALVAGLEEVVIPVVEQTAATLRQNATDSVRIEILRDMIVLVVRGHSVKGELRFQIHQTLLPFASREPVSWMSAIYDGRKLIGGQPGTLPGLADPGAVARVAHLFVEEFLAAWKSTAARRGKFSASAPKGV